MIQFVLHHLVTIATQNMKETKPLLICPNFFGLTCGIASPHEAFEILSYLLYLEQFRSKFNIFLRNKTSSLRSFCPFKLPELSHLSTI